MDTILTDKREISSVSFGEEGFCVGHNGVTRIEAYQEPGQSAYVPWFAIFEDDKIVARANAAHVVSVAYFTDDG